MALALSSLFLYGTLVVIIGSISFTGVKVMKLTRPRKVSTEIKCKKNTS